MTLRGFRNALAFGLVGLLVYLCLSAILAAVWFAFKVLVSAAIAWWIVLWLFF